MIHPNTSVAGEWEELPDFTGGDVYSLCIDSTGNIYAGTKSGFIYKSSDDGNTWIEFFDGLEPAYHSNLLIKDIEYLESGILVAAVQNQGCFALDLSSQSPSWSKISFTPSNPDFFAIQANGNVLIAASNKSSQIDFFVIEHISGTNFKITSKNYPGLISQFIVGSDNKIFLVDVNQKGIYISTDKGDTWVKSDGEMKDIEIYLFTPGRMPSEFFIIDRSFNLYLTQDNAESWTKIADQQSLNGAFIFNAVIFEDDSIILFTNRGTYIGTLGSNEWNLINREVFSFTQLQKKGVLYSTKEQQALIKSTDKGATWKEYKTGMTALEIIDMVEAKDTTFFAISKKHIYRLLIGSQQWEQVSPDTIYNDYTIIRTNKFDFLYVGTEGKKMLHSVDNGNRFDTIQFNLGNCYYVKELLFLPNEDMIMHCRESAYNFLISKDLGYDWNYFNLSTIPEPVSNNFYMSIAVDSSNGVYIGALNNFIFQTDDEGEYWRHIFNYEFTPYDIEINAQFNIYCIAYKDAIQHKIYSSFDQGDTWEEIEYFTGTSSKIISDVLVHKNKVIVNYKDNLNNKDEIYLSEDWGETWTNIGDDNLPHINKLYFKYDFLYACTTKGIFRYSDQVVGVKNDPFQNELMIYPNPAKDFVIIQTNDIFEKTRIRLFSVEGVLIKDNYNLLSDNGIKLDISDIPQGVYVVELSSSNGVASKLFVKQ
jgi:photosystem II stability/assembly factor-like uncharacterized protein